MEALSKKVGKKKDDRFISKLKIPSSPSLIRQKFEQQCGSMKRTGGGSGTVTRVQADFVKHRGDQIQRENLLRDLERERMLRMDAENRLRDATLESDDRKARIQSLHDEFKRMEDLVLEAVQYKNKIEQLKQERASLAITYESNLQKYQEHITDMERENMVLMTQCKKMETERNKSEEHDKTKLLLERLKILESENSSLVLENESQRQSYEKCLDEIANQVVQALLTQKTLREECLKLQGRVQDLELQNRRLNVMFSGHSHIQTVVSRSLQPPRRNSVEGRIPHQDSSTSLPAHSPSGQHSKSAMARVSSPGARHHSASPSTLLFERSMESLQSMCSDYLFEDDAVTSDPFSPPPWDYNGSPLTLSTAQTSLTSPLRIQDSTPSPQISPHIRSALNSISQTSLDSGSVTHMKIETEFPATKNSSPKSKRISVGLGQQLASSSDSMLVRHRCEQQQFQQQQFQQQQYQQQHFPELDTCTDHNLDCLPEQTGSQCSLSGPSVMSQVADSPGASLYQSYPSAATAQSPSLPRTPMLQQFSGAFVDFPSSSSLSLNQVNPNYSPPRTMRNSVSQTLREEGVKSPGWEWVSPTNKSSSYGNQSNQSYSSYLANVSMEPQVDETSDDDDAMSRPHSRNYSTASTISLNELLDNGMSGHASVDDAFSMDNYSTLEFCESDIESLPLSPISDKMTISPLVSSGKTSVHTSTPETAPTSPNHVPAQRRTKHSSSSSTSSSYNHSHVLSQNTGYVNGTTSYSTSPAQKSSTKSSPSSSISMQKSSLPKLSSRPATSKMPKPMSVSDSRPVVTSPLMNQEHFATSLPTNPKSLVANQRVIPPSPVINRKQFSTSPPTNQKPIPAASSCNQKLAQQSAIPDSKKSPPISRIPGSKIAMGSKIKTTVHQNRQAATVPGTGVKTGSPKEESTQSKQTANSKSVRKDSRSKITLGASVSLCQSNTSPPSISHSIPSHKPGKPDKTKVSPSERKDVPRKKQSQIPSPPLSNNNNSCYKLAKSPGIISPAPCPSFKAIISSGYINKGHVTHPFPVTYSSSGHSQNVQVTGNNGQSHSGEISKIAHISPEHSNNRMTHSQGTKLRPKSSEYQGTYESDMIESGSLPPSPLTNPNTTTNSCFIIHSENDYGNEKPAVLFINDGDMKLHQSAVQKNLQTVPVSESPQTHTLMHSDLLDSDDHREMFNICDSVCAGDKASNGVDYSPTSTAMIPSHAAVCMTSSGSSCESIRVERSGSKDDGYSTMSSDVHPEALEKLSDTGTVKRHISGKTESSSSEADICMTTTVIVTTVATTVICTMSTTSPTCVSADVSASPISTPSFDSSFSTGDQKLSCPKPSKLSNICRFEHMNKSRPPKFATKLETDENFSPSRLPKINASPPRDVHSKDDQLSSEIIKSPLNIKPVCSTSLSSTTLVQSSQNVNAIITKKPLSKLPTMFAKNKLSSGKVLQMRKIFEGSPPQRTQLNGYNGDNTLTSSSTCATADQAPYTCTIKTNTSESSDFVDMNSPSSCDRVPPVYGDMSPAGSHGGAIERFKIPSFNRYIIDKSSNRTDSLDVSNRTKCAEFSDQSCVIRGSPDSTQPRVIDIDSDSDSFFVCQGGSEHSSTEIQDEFLLQFGGDDRVLEDIAEESEDSPHNSPAKTPDGANRKFVRENKNSLSNKLPNSVIIHHTIFEKDVAAIQLSANRLDERWETLSDSVLVCPEKYHAKLTSVSGDDINENAFVCVRKSMVRSASLSAIKKDQTCDYLSLQRSHNQALVEEETLSQKATSMTTREHFNEDVYRYSSDSESEIEDPMTAVEEWQQRAQARSLLTRNALQNKGSTGNHMKTTKQIEEWIQNALYMASEGYRHNLANGLEFTSDRDPQACHAAAENFILNDGKTVTKKDFLNSDNGFISDVGMPCSASFDELGHVDDTQKCFRNEFYSLCRVESSRSLCSASSFSINGESDSRHAIISSKSAEQTGDVDCNCSESNTGLNNNNSTLDSNSHPVHDQVGEFDEISRQIAALSQTVDDFNRSLSSLNSIGSSSISTDLDKPESSEEFSKDEQTDGFQWVDDEFYLAPCSGEVMISSNSPLVRQTVDCFDWPNGTVELPVDFHDMDYHAELDLHGFEETLSNEGIIECGRNMKRHSFHGNSALEIN